jgi:hypothetical protein
MRAWLAKTVSKMADSKHEKATPWLEKDALPRIGNMPITAVTAIGPREVLRALRVIEARGAVDSAHCIKQICGQVLRYTVAEGSAERYMTADLRGALAHAEKKHYAALTELPQLGGLMRSIFDDTANAHTVKALKLTPLVFSRPGELRAAEWSEFNLDTAEWRIPAAR